MYPNFHFANSDKNILEIIPKLSDFNDIPSYTQFKKESFSFDENSENDYLPKSAQNLEEIIPEIFKQPLDVDETKEESNKGMDIYEQLFTQKIKPEKSPHDIEQKDIIQQKLRDEIFSKRPFKDNNQKFVGRKRKSDERPRKHNKFADDNLLRKGKNLILNCSLDFINQKINSVYSNESKAISKEKQLYKLSSQLSDKSKISYMKSLLSKTLVEIFSEGISTKYSRHNPNHNKDLIKELTNDKDETKRLIFQKIFKLTFFECLEHFRGSCFKEELSGMKTFEEYCSDYDFGDHAEDYKNLLTIFVKNYETILNQQNSRKSKKQNLDN